MSRVLIAAALLAVLAVLLGALYRQWRRNQRLETQLEAAAADLQHLQEACSRLAPAGVVQRLVADGVAPGVQAAADRMRR